MRNSKIFKKRYLQLIFYNNFNLNSIVKIIKHWSESILYCIQNPFAQIP